MNKGMNEEWSEQLTKLSKEQELMQQEIKGSETSPSGKWISPFKMSNSP